MQLLQTAFLHIDVTSASVNPISGGTSCTYVNHSLHRSVRQTNHIQPVPFKGPDSVVDSYFNTCNLMTDGDVNMQEC